MVRSGEATPVAWDDEVDEIIGGDLTAVLGYVTPASGVVISPVAWCGQTHGRGIDGRSGPERGTGARVNVRKAGRHLAGRERLLHTTPGS